MAAQESPIATHVRDRIDRYVGDIVRHCDRAGTPLVSVVLFGSGATGGYTVGVSDLDLLLVLDDASDAADNRRITQVVSDLEILHGLAKPKGWPGDPSANAMQRIADRLTANVRTFFVCTRADLLSGEAGSHSESELASSTVR